MSEQSGPTISSGKLGATTSKALGVDIFYTPLGDRFACNSACAGCYVANNFEPGQRVIPSAEVPEMIGQLQEAGYVTPYLITTEALLAPNWEDILKASGDKYINTNGKIIAARGPKILSKMAAAGVEQIIITANVPGLHDELNLTPPHVVERAFEKIAEHNGQNPDAPFKTVASAIITATNYDEIAEMCEQVKKVYGADGIKFIAYIPMTGGSLPSHPDLAPTKEQIFAAIEQIAVARASYDSSEFYVQRGGTLGPKGLSPDKLATLCPAGDAMHAVKSLNDGAPVTPCIFAPATPIGKMRYGKPEINPGQLEAFLVYKGAALAAGYCPALAGSIILSAPDKLPVKEPNVAAMKKAFESIVGAAPDV